MFAMSYSVLECTVPKVDLLPVDV